MEIYLLKIFPFFYFAKNVVFIGLFSYLLVRYFKNKAFDLGFMKKVSIAVFSFSAFVLLYLSIAQYYVSKTNQEGLGKYFFESKSKIDFVFGA